MCSSDLPSSPSLLSFHANTACLLHPIQFFELALHRRSDAGQPITHRAPLRWCLSQGQPPVCLLASRVSFSSQLATRASCSGLLGAVLLAFLPHSDSLLQQHKDPTCATPSHSELDVYAHCPPFLSRCFSYGCVCPIAPAPPLHFATICSKSSTLRLATLPQPPVYLIPLPHPHPPTPPSPPSLSSPILRCMIEHQAL